MSKYARLPILAAMPANRRTLFEFADDLATLDYRLCDHPLCAEPGHYRAPMGRDNLNRYYWFCLDHVRAYNKEWDFFRGMNQAQIEAAIRADTIWQRETRPLGQWAGQDARLREAAEQAYHGDRNQDGASRPDPRPQDEESEALQTLGLRAPVEFAAIKSRYIELVKALHPDANGGDPVAEERLKGVNRAFTVLKSSYIPLD